MKVIHSKTLTAARAFLCCLVLAAIFAACSNSTSNDAEADSGDDGITFSIDSALAERIALLAPRSQSSSRMARSLSVADYENLYVDVELTGGYTAKETLALTPAGATAHFDEIPVGATITAKARAYYKDGDDETDICEGESDPYTIKVKDNELDITMTWLAGASATLDITGMSVPSAVASSLRINIEVTGTHGFSESRTELRASDMPLSLTGIPVGIMANATASAYYEDNGKTIVLYRGELGGTSIADGSNTLSIPMNWALFGTKIPKEEKAVGDIVFKDGSATAYTSSLVLSDEQKDAAIAVIFYKGTDCSNYGETTPQSRTLGVGLARSTTGFYLCTSAAKWSTTSVVAVATSASQSGNSYSFTGDKNGSDNLSAIASGLGAEDDTAVQERYPAFYYAVNYKEQAESHVNGTDYADGWYLPALAELEKVWAATRSSDKPLNSIIETCGGRTIPFNTSNSYWSSSQESATYGIFMFQNSDGTCQRTSTAKTGGARRVCPIREF